MGVGVGMGVGVWVHVGLGVEGGRVGEYVCVVRVSGDAGV